MCMGAREPKRCRKKNGECELCANVSHAFIISGRVVSTSGLIYLAETETVPRANISRSCFTFCKLSETRFLQTETCFDLGKHLRMAANFKSHALTVIRLTKDAHFCTDFADGALNIIGNQQIFIDHVSFEIADEL